MRILIANGRMGFRSGSEVHVRDLALALRRRGHEVQVFAGILREDDDVRTLRESGVRLTADLATLSEPDVIQGHQKPETSLVCARFPGTPAIQVCHDATNGRDAAGPGWMIQRRCAVDDYCRERVVRETGTTPASIDVLFNPVDLAHVPRRLSPAATPPRTAVLFHGARDTRRVVDLVREACAEAGITLDVLGPGTGKFEYDPGLALSRYDLVFGKARCALEAMASGAHVVLLGPQGLGPRPGPENFAELLRRNFGRSLLTLPLERASLARRIAELDPGITGKLTDLVRRECGSARLAETMEKIYAETAVMPTRRPWLKCRLTAAWALARLRFRQWRVARSEAGGSDGCAPTCRPRHGASGWP